MIARSKRSRRTGRLAVWSRFTRFVQSAPRPAHTGLESSQRRFDLQSGSMRPPLNPHRLEFFAFDRIVEIAASFERMQRDEQKKFLKLRRLQIP
jgi:hypothetical protein